MFKIKNIFISFCAVSFFQSGCLLLNNEFAGFVPSNFIFWSTLFIYKINTRDTLRLLKEFSFERINKRAFLEIGIIASSLLITLLHIPFLNFPTVISAGALGILSILYNLPEKTLSSRILPLRSIPLLKVFLIAFVWSATSTLLPLAIAQMPKFPSDVFLLFAAHFLFILSITLPFDLRDYHNDRKHSLLTVPHVIGIANTKLLALLCISGFIIIMSTQIGWDFLLPLFFAAAVLIIFAKPERNEFYFTFWLDGTILLYFLMICLSFTFSV